jgi:hypothetical protein
MRLKEDKNSWQASNILRKILPLPTVFAHRPHKNTRRWCKGVVGREHRYKIVERQVILESWIYVRRQCRRCGRKEIKEESRK